MGPEHLAEQRRARGGLVIFLVAILASSWTLALPFQFDDYWLLPSANAQLGRLGQVLGIREDARADRVLIEQPLIDHLFQPCLWVLYQLEEAVSGRPYRPVVFHAGSLFLHALGAWCFFRLLRKLVKPGPALVGGLFFALHPAGAQAVSWVAAGGDLLSVSFMCLALVIASGRRPGVMQALLSGSCAALAFGSKVSGLAVLGLLLPTLFLRSRNPGLRSRFLLVATALLPSLALLVARRLYLETWTFGYWGGTRVDFSNLHELPRALPRLVTQLLVPWNPLPEAREHDALLQGLLEAVAPTANRRSLLWIWILPPLAALVSRRSRRAFLASFAAAVILTLPALFPWRVFLNVEDNSLGRTLYPLVPVLGLLLAAAAEGIGSGRVRMALLLPFFLIAVDTHQHIARTELAAANAVAIRKEGVIRALKADPEGVVVALDARPDYAAIPLTASAIQILFLEPFAEHSRSVRFHPTMDHLFRSGLLGVEARAVRIVEWDGEAMVERAVLPAFDPKAPPPLLVTEGKGNWRPESPCVPRAFPGLRLKLAPGAPAAVEIVARGEGNREERLQLEFTAAASELVVALDRRPGWTLLSKLERLEIRGEDRALARLAAAPQLLRKLPELRPIDPLRDARFPLGDEVLLAVEGVDPGAVLEVSYRIEVASLMLHLVHESRPGDHRVRGDAVVFPAGSGRLLRASLEGLSWDRLPGLFERYMVPLNVDHLRVIWSVSERVGPGVKGRRTAPTWFFYEAKKG